VKVDSISV